MSLGCLTRGAVSFSYSTKYEGGKEGEKDRVKGADLEEIQVEEEEESQKESE
jgi:hypothetical protein